MQAMSTEDKAQWRQTVRPLNVTYLWWYDTVAILPEYDDTENGILPAGEFIRFFDSEGGKTICDLHDPKRIEKCQLPAGRIRRFRPFAFATPLQAILDDDDFSSTIPADPPGTTICSRLLSKNRKQLQPPPRDRRAPDTLLTTSMKRFLLGSVGFLAILVGVIWVSSWKRFPTKEEVEATVVARADEKVTVDTDQADVGFFWIKIDAEDGSGREYGMEAIQRWTFPWQKYGFGQ
jgi:hypothetical protein